MSEWIPVEGALERLGVQRQTLYAYVSRGLVRARPDEDDPRRSLYAESDLARLKGRRRGARRRAEVAASAIAWGEPVLESAISTVRDGMLIFRGRAVDELARRATLEEVACLLWQSDAPKEKAFPSLKADGATAKARAFILLARRAAEDALRESQQFNQQIIDSALEGIAERGAGVVSLAIAGSSAVRFAVAVSIAVLRLGRFVGNGGTTQVEDGFGVDLDLFLRTLHVAVTRIAGGIDEVELEVGEAIEVRGEDQILAAGMEIRCPAHRTELGDGFLIAAISVHRPEDRKSVV